MRGEGLLGGLIASEADFVECCLAPLSIGYSRSVRKLNWANLGVENRGPKVFARDRIELKANERLIRR
jgi:hypothetical protein